MRTATTKFGFNVVSGTALEQQLAGMAEGTIEQFSADNFTLSLIETGTGTALDFANKAYFDPHNNTMYFWGAGHAPSRGVALKYDAITNSFADFTPPGIPPIEGPKHSYEHIAFRPRTGQKGILYYRNYYSYTVERLDLETGTWDTIAPIRPPGSSSVLKQVACALEWFPELYGGLGGLVYFDGDWGVRLWHPTNDEWTGIGDTNMPGVGDYHNFATYCPDQQVVLFGGGNSSTAVYEVNANQVKTRKQDCPYKLGVDEKGIVLACPGKKITAFCNDGNIYEFDYAGNQWSGSVGTQTLFQTTDRNVVGASNDNYGCAFFMRSGNPPTTYVYKFRTA